MVLVKMPVNEALENELSSYEEKGAELKQKMSELTKEGKDTSIMRIKFADLSPAIRMARATYDEKDVAKVRSIVEDLEKELEIAEHGSDFDNALALIKSAYEDIREGRRAEAAKKYSQITEYYKRLSGELKRAVYVACLDIHKRLSEPPEESGVYTDTDLEASFGGGPGNKDKDGAVEQHKDES